MKLSRSTAYAGIIALGILARVVCALLTPAWQSPDEYPHYWYAEQIARDGFLPMSAPSFPAYESFQPPLYYLLLTLPVSAAPSTVPFSAVPSARPDAGLIIARMLSVLFALVTLWLFAKILRNLNWLTNTERLVALAVVSFLPTYIGVSSTVNNDSLVILLSAVSLFYLLRSDLSPDHLALASFWAGVALLAKLTAILLLPALVIAAWGVKRSEGTSARSAFSALLLWSIGAVILIARNLWQFGDLPAINPGVTKQPDLSLVHLLDAAKTFTGSFFFAFGRTYQITLPKATYALLFLPMILLALVGWIRQWPQDRKYGPMLILPIIAGVLASLGYTLLYPAETMTSWGKNMYPLLPVVALVLAIGWERAVPRQFRGWVSGSFVLVLLLLTCYGLIQTSGSF